MRHWLQSVHVMIEVAFIALGRMIAIHIRTVQYKAATEVSVHAKLSWPGMHTVITFWYTNKFLSLYLLHTYIHQPYRERRFYASTKGSENISSFGWWRPHTVCTAITHILVFISFSSQRPRQPKCPGSFHPVQC